MALWKKIGVLPGAFVLCLACGFSSQLQAAASEQTVRLSVSKGEQCEVQAVFRGDQDNCSLDDARGRAKCTKDTGCVCTRQEKHVSWKMDGDHPFRIVFDQGDGNPFVANGQKECNFKSNKKGQLRCRVKGKDVPKGQYDYSIEVDGCKAARSRVEIY